MKKMRIRVNGMVCAACEATIATALRDLKGLRAVQVSLKASAVDVEYDESVLSIKDIEERIEKAGYGLGSTRSGGGLAAIGIGLILAALYGIASWRGFFNSLPVVDASIGYAALFLIGLFTSLHCVSMCGGIALSQSLRVGAQEETAVGRQGLRARFRIIAPSLAYNAGRVVSYSIIGALAGALGSVFNFSTMFKALIMALAALFMLLFGLKSLGLFSFIPSLERILPKPVHEKLRALRAKLSGKSPFIVGLLNGFMPCGPLQSMQVYAMGTGSAVTGALSLFLFSLGTIPLLLAFGLSAAIMPRRILPSVLKASAVLILFMGLTSLGRAVSLAGIALPTAQSLMAQTAPDIKPRKPNSLGISGKRAVVSGGSQSITTGFDRGLYLPFTVQAGLPLRWTIRVSAQDLNGCNNPLTVPSLGIRKMLMPGDNVIEFTPAKAGAIGYTCWMGMISSRITVVEDLGSDAEPQELAPWILEVSGKNPGTACACCEQ